MSSKNTVIALIAVIVSTLALFGPVTPAHCQYEEEGGAETGSGSGSGTGTGPVMPPTTTPDVENPGGLAVVPNDVPVETGTTPVTDPVTEQDDETPYYTEGQEDDTVPVNTTAGQADDMVPVDGTSGTRGAADPTVATAATGDTGRGLENAAPAKPLDQAQTTKVVQGSIGAAVSNDGSGPTVTAEGSVSTTARGGVEVSGDVKAGAGVNPGKPLTASLEASVGNEIVGPKAYAAGYQAAVQTILTRQTPSDPGLPTQVKQGLETVGQLNKDGKLDGAVTINVDKDAAVASAVAGAQQGIIDTPFLRIFQRTGRPGFVGIRTRIAGRREGQLAAAASDSIDDKEAQVTAASNNVVQFNNGPVSQTGARVNLSGQGVEANVGATVNDFNTFQNSFGRRRRR